MRPVWCVAIWTSFFLVIYTKLAPILEPTRCGQRSLSGNPYAFSGHIEIIVILKDKVMSTCHFLFFNFAKFGLHRCSFYWKNRLAKKLSAFTTVSWMPGPPKHTVVPSTCFYVTLLCPILTRDRPNLESCLKFGEPTLSGKCH